jgi:hypothetical protein
MPRKNMSLDNRLGRYHRIGSPTDKARVEGDRPLECALCHADMTVGALVERMESWWGKRYDRAALVKLYGGLDARPLIVALIGGKAHEQATALGVLREQAESGEPGRAAVRKLAPLISAQLTHGYPILRYYAVRALQAALGQAPPIDLHQDDAKIRAQADAWLAGFGMAAPRPSAGAPPPSDGPDE